MRILICDDDTAAVAELQSAVRAFFAERDETPELVCYPGGDALLAAPDLRADLAFLDVEMPGTDGITVGARLKQANPSVKIFIVTAYPDYLDEAMRFQVFRYLSKPLDRERLFRNLREAVRLYVTESRPFPIRTAEGVVVRRAEEIVCVETVRRKVLITTTAETLISAAPIEHWRRTLDLPCFYSPHRAFIINLAFVNSITRDSILLKNGNQEKTAFLARRKYAECKAVYLRWAESVG